IRDRNVTGVQTCALPICCFFNWLVESGQLERSPFRGLRNVRLPQRIVQPLSGDEVTRLLAACPADSAAGLRDRAMLLTLLDTGRSEERRVGKGRRRPRAR